MVDDQKACLDLYEAILKAQISHDLIILKATCVTEALPLIKEYSIDLIISDLSMPDIDGQQFSKILKSETKTKKIPIIIATGFASFQLKYADAYFRKGDNINKLVNLANVFLNKKEVDKAVNFCKMKTLMFVLAFQTLFSIGSKFVSDADAGNSGYGSVLDNNAGNKGDILVHSGNANGNSDIGTWVDSGTFDGKDGVDGKDGLNGKSGTDGANGTDGINGNDGSQGNKGVKGDTGEKGKRGKKGVKGNTGTDGTDGADGIDGADGVKGDKGNKGNKGNKGIQGIQGIQGLLGNTGATGSAGTPADMTKVTNNTTNIKNNKNNISKNTSRIDDNSNRISKLEKTQVIIEGQARVYDGEKWQVKLFASYSTTRSKFDRVGVKFMYKVGKSYEEKLLEEQLERLEEIERRLGVNPIESVKVGLKQVQECLDEDCRIERRQATHNKEMSNEERVNLDYAEKNYKMSLKSDGTWLVERSF